MTNDLKCKDCIAPVRHPGCHTTCKYYLEWKKKHDAEKKKERDLRWLSNLSRPDKPRRK